MLQQPIKELNQHLRKQGKAVDQPKMPCCLKQPTQLCQFVQEEEPKQCKIPPRTRFGQLKAAPGWQLQVDVGQQLMVSSAIAITNFRPDLVLWSKGRVLEGAC